MRPTSFFAAFFVSASFLAAADPALLNMIMPDAKIVAGVNVSRAETSPFGQFILRSMPLDQGFQQFVGMSGFDPRTDLQELLVASNATAKTGIVLARGKFNAAQLASTAVVTGGFTTSTYNGAQLITPVKSGFAMAIVLDSNPATLAIMGDLASVKGALDRRSTSNPVNPVMASKIASYGGSDAWSVSLVPLSSLGMGGKSNPMAGAMAGDILNKVQATSGGITFSSPVQITGEAVADTPQNASALGDVVRFFATMLKNTSGDSTAPAGSQVSALMQGLDVTTDQNTVKITLSIPESQLENMVQPTHAKTGIL